MIYILAIAFVFSFLGSIPPGAINLSVLQLSIEGNFKAALRFALAAAIVEFPYAFVAVKFQAYLLNAPVITDNIKLIAAIVMLILGFINIYTSSRSVSKTINKLKQSGFRKGIVISILNPLAIPFWIGITAYLDGLGWIKLTSLEKILWYVSGISLGTFALLLLIALLGKRISTFLSTESWVVRYVPGIVYLLLGFYALAEYFNLL